MVESATGPSRQSRRERGGTWSALLSFPSSLDFVQLLSLMFLLGVGLVFIRSTGEQVGTEASLGFFAKQLRWIGGGAVLWLLAASVDYRKIQYRVLSVLFYLAMLALLVLVLFIGVKINGARSWIYLKPIGMSLQPSEFSKLSVVLLLSAMFSTPMFNVNRLACLLLGAAAVALPFGLIMLEPDFGSGVILIPVFVGIVFCAGLKWRYILLATAAVALIGGGLVLNEVAGYRPLLKPYQINRIKVFLNPELDLMGSGYNSYQARLAVGSGGMTGKGIGEGTQNSLGFLPQTVSNNDFIFSVIAEEAGFVGCFLIILAYLALFYSVVRTALATSDPFGRYIAIGIGCIVFPHCFINIGMCIGVTPVTGVPLPFISYGGSFVLMGMLAFGILQSVYRHRR